MQVADITFCDFSGNDDSISIGETIDCSDFSSL